jgi:two-component system, LytTR family, sensor kinase
MNHPVFQNLRTILLYFGIWILAAGIHFSVLFFFYEETLDVCVADCLIFNLLFSILALPIWYTVRYSQASFTNLFNLIFSHLISLIIILFIWFGAGSAILHSMFRLNTSYNIFFAKSIPWRLISGILFYLMVVMFYYIVIYYNNLQAKLKNEAQLNEMIKDSELNLLKAQINPHFLFNSLNSVSSLTITDPERAREMLAKLSEFLRYSVSRNAERFSSLKLELENTQRYLDIEKVRFGSKLEYKFEMAGDCMCIDIPVMILQPLYENAVKHGVYESTGQVTIWTRCNLHDNYTEIIISNNFEPGAPSRKGAGIGLKNTRERLKLIYRNEKLLKTEIRDNVFEVVITIPSMNPTTEK